MNLIVHNEVIPTDNQIETHLFYQRTKDAEFFDDYGIQHHS